MEQHGSSVDIPPLKIMITKGRQDLTVKVYTSCVSRLLYTVICTRNCVGSLIYSHQLNLFSSSKMRMALKYGLY